MKGGSTIDQIDQAVYGLEVYPALGGRLTKEEAKLVDRN